MRLSPNLPAMKKSSFPLGGLVLLVLAVMFAETAHPAVPTNAIARGEKFLAELFDPELRLLPEFRGSKTYWLFHDNYLAAKLLAATQPKLAAELQQSLGRHGVTNSGKIEIIFGEAARPLPFRTYVLTNVAVVSGKTIRTEIVTERVLPGWEEYADLLLLAAIAQATNAPVEARRHFDRAAALWDGRGFHDRVIAKQSPGQKRYATYKLALYLIAAGRLPQPAPHAAEVRQQLLALQNDAGGWITDYTPEGRPVGQANVETTCLALLAVKVNFK